MTHRVHVHSYTPSDVFSNRVLFSSSVQRKRVLIKSNLATKRIGIIILINTTHHIVYKGEHKEVQSLTIMFSIKVMKDEAERGFWSYELMKYNKMEKWNPK